METAIFSLQSPTTPEATIAQVRRQLTVDYPDGVDAHGNAIDPIAEAAVRDLWGGRVKNFVTVLALREVRTALRTQAQEGTATPSQVDAMFGDQARIQQPGHGRDSQRLTRDVLLLDEKDVLHL